VFETRAGGPEWLAGQQYAGWPNVTLSIGTDTDTSFSGPHTFSPPIKEPMFWAWRAGTSGRRRFRSASLS
jgi:hypothetical protein